MHFIVLYFIICHLSLNMNTKVTYFLNFFFVHTEEDLVNKL